MAENYNDEYSLSLHEFNAVKLLVRTLSHQVENILACDISSIKDGHPELHLILTELQEHWESQSVADAYDLWEEDISQC